MADETPRPTNKGDSVLSSLVASDGTHIQIGLVNDEQHVLVSGPNDSLLIPIHGLKTTIDESGPVAKQVRSDASHQSREQMPPGVSGLEDGHSVVINGVTYQVLDVHQGDGDQWQMTVGPVPL